MPLLIALACILLLPLATGVAACAVCGRPYRRRYPARALLVHGFHKRSFLDCSYVHPAAFEGALRQLSADGHLWMRVSDVPCDMQPEDPVPICLTFDDGLRTVLEAGVPTLDRLGIRATFFPIAGVLGASDGASDVYGVQEYLSAAQLRALAEAGHEIGSHTMSHADLVRLSESDLLAELRDSRARLQDAIGRPVTSISFPYGSWNTHVWKAAQSCGYTHATAYRSHHRLVPGVIPATGTYAFDTASHLCQRFTDAPPWSSSRALARIMPHFAMGSSLWRFRDAYALRTARHT